MNNISDKIKSGARAFLVTEYKYLAVYVLIVCIILVILYTLDPPSGSETDGVRYAACFLAGAFLSGAAGWGGMAVATVSHLGGINFFSAFWDISNLTSIPLLDKGCQCSHHSGR